MPWTAAHCSGSSLCFISLPQELEWIVLVGEAYFCWLFISGSGQFYGAILSVSNPFFNHSFTQQLHCPELAPYINTSHTYVFHVSQDTKLPLQTPFRRTAVSLRLLATRLAGYSWRRWYPCSLLDFLGISLRWQAISLHINSRSQECFWVSGIRTILRLSQIQTGVRLGCFLAPAPALESMGILLEALPLCLRETRPSPY